MITPRDIDNKVFKRQMWGYSIDDVENFLEEITDSYEALYKENLAAAERISMLTDAVRQYKTMEDSMQNTMPVHAEEEKIPEKVCTAGGAEETAAAQELIRLTYQYEQMKRSVEVFRAKAVALLNAQLDIIKDYSEIKIDDKTLQEAKAVYDDMLINVQRKLSEQADEESTAEIPALKKEADGSFGTYEEK